MCPLCHAIYHSCDKGLWSQSLLLTVRCCNMCGRNLITGLTSAVSPRLEISSTCKVGQKLKSVSPSVDTLPFSVTILAIVPQRSKVPGGLLNYPVYRKCDYSIKPGLSQDPLISDHSAQDTKWDLVHYFFFLFSLSLSLFLSFFLSFSPLCISRLLLTFHACCTYCEGCFKDRNGWMGR